MNKREEVISWNEYFMGIAHLSALRSKDPSTQVGAVIVDEDHKVVSIGYNGFPKGCSDDVFPWSRDGESLDTKYVYVVHAELNAILNSPRLVKDCTLYVSLFPCHECAKALIQAGIKDIYYKLNDEVKHEFVTDWVELENKRMKVFIANAPKVKPKMSFVEACNQANGKNSSS